MPDPVPRVARRMLRLAADAEHRDAMLDDLDEEAPTLAAASGLAAARRWSRQQVLSLGGAVAASAASRSPSRA